MSLTGVPRCWWRTTSESMNTVHCSPQSTGCSAARARRAKSRLMLMPSFSACSSRKLPVPAAQALFMVKSLTRPFSSRTYLESCPPISKMVSTSGQMNAEAVAWAVISLTTTSAPARSPMRWRPEPVTPTACTSANSPYRSRISRNPVRTASMGRLAVMR